MILLFICIFLSLTFLISKIILNKAFKLSTYLTQDQYVLFRTISQRGTYLSSIFLSFIILKVKKSSDILCGLSKLDNLLKVSAA